MGVFCKILEEKYSIDSKTFFYDEIKILQLQSVLWSKDLEMAIAAMVRTYGKKTRGVETMQILGAVPMHVWVESLGMMDIVVN